MVAWHALEVALIDAIELALEGAAAVVIAVSAAHALLALVLEYRTGTSVQARMRRVRLPFVQNVIFALDLLVAADILRTVVTPTLDRVIVLGSIVAIRIVLAFTLTYEMGKAMETGAMGDRGAD